MPRPARYTIRMVGPVPTVDQGLINEWPVSFNPDDGKFHVANLSQRSVTIQQHWRNVVRWCLTHTAPAGPVGF